MNNDLQHKSNAVNSILNRNTKFKSTNERNIRVQNRSQIPPTIKQVDLTNSSNLIKLGDTVLSLVRSKNESVSTVVVSLNKIIFEGKSTSYISLDDFDSCSTLTGRVLKFMSHTNDQIIWNSNYGDEFSFKSAHSVVFCTSLADGITNIYTYINVFNLNEALTALKTVYHSLPNTTKLPLI